MSPASLPAILPRSSGSDCSMRVQAHAQAAMGRDGTRCDHILSRHSNLASHTVD